MAAAANASSADLRGFLGALDGADPILAIAALRALAETLPQPGVDALLHEALTPVPRRPSDLPIVHPLDFAWLFTRDSQSRLLAHAADATRPGELIVYLGCPTLQQRGREQLPERRHLLLDRDARRVAQANRDGIDGARQIDLLTDALPDVDAAMVVADPPLYPGPARAFVNAAAILLRSGGILLLAFADALTRPGADEDLGDVLRAARQEGFDLTGLRTARCRYRTPPFERAALDAAGLPGVPDDWRLGSLSILRRRDRPAPARLHVEEPRWIPHEVNDIPLRVRPDAPPTGDHLLTPLLEGSILPTVSRRDPRRLNAALWTSRNRIYASSDPTALAYALNRLDEPTDLRPRPQVLTDIAQLVARERHEHGLRVTPRDRVA